MSDVLIVGGGVIGLAVARALAARGAAVTVLDAGQPGQAATAAAAGILSPTDPPEWEGETGRFNVAAIARWPGWAAELEAETGLPSGFEQRGELRVGPAEQDGGPFVASAVSGATTAGWPFERLGADGIRALEPAVAAEDRVGVLLPGTATASTDALTRALLRSCELRGVDVRAGVRVGSVDPDRRRVSTGDAEIGYGRLILATGAALPAGLGTPLRCGVRPILGERLLARPHPDHPVCAITVREAGGPIVPRADGTLWIGVTYLDRGEQALPSIGSVQSIADRATALIPAIAHASLLDVRSGLRPVSDDGAPLLGPVREGVAVALGHGREGIIQAPLTADVLAGGDWDAIPDALRAVAR